MKLEDIGFYTLSDKRVQQASANSPLSRCELILTDKCNFKCGYCMPLRPDCRGELSYLKAANIITAWAVDGLKNIRFSGGEPTLWPYLNSLVRLAKYVKIDRVAVSTNGSASQLSYYNLLNSGVDDFSVSLDACCASTGARMCGLKGQWERVVENIKWLAKRAYVTVGVVLNKNNVKETEKIIELADSLGVADIRLIPASQTGNRFPSEFKVSPKIQKKYPILDYRMNCLYSGKSVRGISKGDCNKCGLVLDDMTVAGSKHFPCIIYMRQMGEPIGEFTDIREVRKARAKWFTEHDTHKDPICSSTCLDVCVDYNNKHFAWNFTNRGIGES